MDEIVSHGSPYHLYTKTPRLIGISKMGLALVPHGIICLNCVLYMSMVRIEDRVREMQKVRDKKSFPKSSSNL